MKEDYSRLLYDVYFKLNYRIIEITLNNGNHLRGELMAFYKGDVNNGEPYIYAWRLRPETILSYPDFESTDSSSTILVYHEDINCIHFTDNQNQLQTLNFYN